MCPECNVALKDHLDNKGSGAVTPDDSWVVVGSVTNDMETEAAKGSLDSNNIPSVFIPPSLDPVSKGMFPGSGAIGPLGDGDLILVPREFQHDATVLLKAVLGDEFWGQEFDENPQL